MDLKIKQWPIGRLKAYPNNPRSNDHVVGRMVDALREFGFVAPVLVRSNGEVVDGHLRLKAALQLGLKKIPVIEVDGFDNEKIKALRLLMNRSATWADWNVELLKIEVRDLKLKSFPVDLLGFEAIELDTAPPGPKAPRGNKVKGTIFVTVQTALMERARAAIAKALTAARIDHTL